MRKRSSIFSSFLLLTLLKIEKLSKYLLAILTSTSTSVSVGKKCFRFINVQCSVDYASIEKLSFISSEYFMCFLQLYFSKHYMYNPVYIVSYRK